MRGWSSSAAAAALDYDSLHLDAVVHGEIVVRRGGQDHYLAIGEGFAEITGERVAILTDMAMKADDIDETRAEEARSSA